MRASLAVASALAAVLAVDPPAARADIFADYIGERDGGPICFARAYDADHLAAHPAQRVTHFFVVHSDLDDLTPPQSFEVAFGFRLKGVDDVFLAEASCAATEAGEALCSAEGDGGGFRLAGRGARLLATVDGRLELEGMAGFSPDLAQGGDDRAFLLFPTSPDGCRPGP